MGGSSGLGIGLPGTGWIDGMCGTVVGRSGLGMSGCFGSPGPCANETLGRWVKEFMVVRVDQLVASFKVRSASRMLLIPLINASGLKEMLSMPCSTRNFAKAGSSLGAWPQRPMRVPVA